MSRRITALAVLLALLALPVIAQPATPPSFGDIVDTMVAWVLDLIAPEINSGDKPEASQANACEDCEGDSGDVGNWGPSTEPNG